MQSLTQQPRTFQVTFGASKEGNPGIAFIINPASFIETKEDPFPGVLLTPAQAREAAYALLLFAEQLSSGLVNIPKEPL